MYTLGIITNYFSFEALPLLLFCWLVMIICRPFATFLHELGHLFPTYILTKKQIILRIGEGGLVRKKVFSNLEIQFSFKNSNCGFVSVEDDKFTKMERLLILLGGPVATLMMIIFSSFLLLGGFYEGIIGEVLLIGFLCSNLLVFMTSIIPMKLRPSKLFPEGPPSDALEIINLLKSQN